MSQIKERGFTLIELMAVVLIIGILAAIAYPSYEQYVRQARRTDGHGALLHTAGQLEKFYSQCGQYTTAITTGSISACSGLGMSATSPDRHYSLTVTTGNVGTVSAQTYTLTAAPRTTPTPASPQVNDTECGSLTLTNAGVKGRSGTGPMSRCWKQ